MEVAVLLMLAAMMAGCHSMADLMHSKHVVSIERHYQNGFQHRLITIAENAKPTVETINRLVAKSGGRLSHQDFESKWWWGSSEDRIKSPIYLNIDVVRYYRKMSARFRRGDFSDANGVKMLSSSLIYSAVVSPHDSVTIEGTRFPRGFTVDMNFAWSEYCGPICALSFKVSRKVIFDEQGEILAIFGDEEERIMLISRSNQSPETRPTSWPVPV